MIPIRDLVNTAMQDYDEKWGYIFGMSGQIWTQSNRVCGLAVKARPLRRE